MLTTRATRPYLTRWLVLVALVLLVHLALLKSLSVALEPTDPQTAWPLTFATRTLDAPSAVVPLVPSQVVPAPPKAANAARPKVVAPPAATAPAELPDTSAPALPPQPSADEAAATPALPAASAPEVAQTPEATPPTAPPPGPRDKPLRFSADKLSASTRLIYTLKTSKFPFTLNAELLWRNLGDSYNARLRYSAFGQARVQTSQGQITATGLAPERFADKYRSEVAAHFNHAQDKITFSANTPDAPLLPGAQDRLSVLLQLGGLLASDPARYGPGTTLTVQTAGPRSADVWLFTVIQTEPLDLPGGSVQGLKLERNPREPYDQKVEVWLAPELNYLPVRIRITEANGDSADQQWSATESADTAD